MREHASRSSEVHEYELPESSALEAAMPALETQVEDVPGYTKPIADVSAAAAAAVPYETDVEDLRPDRVRDAADVAFGRRVLLESVIGADDRVAIPDTTKLPWRMICALRIRFANGRNYVGTGWFIGPRTVMTAAHCVFAHDEGGWPREIEVIPGLNGTVRPFGSVVGKKFRAPKGWIDGPDSDFDYGAIVLGEDVGQRVGYFGYAVLNNAQLKSTAANISGYPADRDSATKQYFHARTLINATPKRLVYDIDTFGGQSGSPIYLNMNGQRVAVGIHTTGSSRSNSGTRITKEVFDNMNKWRNEK
ncbi:MAG TPA: serine protease [Thermoanaerobaculia bacterium]|nr:serine protease [Thermoanaerobaculia bacterium]